MMSSSRGYGAVSDKVADDGGDGGGDGLGLKLRRVDSFPYYGMMTTHHNRSIFSPLPRSPGDGDDEDDDDDYGSTGGGGLARGSSSNTREDDACRSPVGGDVSRTDTTALNFKYPGGGNMGVVGSGSFPFTGEQWKELGRQAMIYKYIMASVPVPPYLLFSSLPANLSRHPDSSLSYRALEVGGSPLLNFRLSGRTDPEPGRCKRTDGKKWRCSKDVEPNQKYCDRHINRGRPRSRKPVEHQLNNPQFHHRRPSAAAPATAISPISPFLRSPSHHLCTPSPRLPAFDFPSVSANAFQEQRRVDYWERKEGSHSDRRMQASSSGFNSCGNFSAIGEDQQNQREDCPMFLNPDLLTIERPPLERGFIDAWSNADKNESSVSPSTCMKHSLSDLSDVTLSMAMDCGSLIEEMGPIQMGLGVSHSDQNSKPHAQPQTQAQVSGWLSSDSWVSPTPGGPLAEVLKRPRSVAGSGRATASRYGGDSGSPPVMALSSPSGVLHRGLGSVSDSSGHSSPTLGTPATWLNRGR